MNCLHNATESKTPKVLAASLEGTHTHTPECTVGREEANEIHHTTYQDGGTVFQNTA